jgi:hypothetical protein
MDDAAQTPPGAPDGEPGGEPASGPGKYRQPDDRLRYGRAALAVSFFAQGALFALLVTRIPAIQDRYGISDGLLPVFLAAVPILAGAGSIATEQIVKRIRPSVVLRWVQPVVAVVLLLLGAGDRLWVAAVTLALFGVCVGGLDASMNMLGVSLQHTYGRSIMLGFHASYSLGGIVGASLAWSGAHWHFALVSLYGPAVAVLIPLTLVASRWYADQEQPLPGGLDGGGGRQPVVMRLLLPLCLVMAFAYIGDSTVSNWSAKYLQDTLHSSEQLSTVPYAVYRGGDGGVRGGGGGARGVGGDAGVHAAGAGAVCDRAADVRGGRADVPR